MPDVSPLSPHEVLAHYLRQHADADFGVTAARMVVDLTQRVVALEHRVRELETAKKR